MVYEHYTRVEEEFRNYMANTSPTPHLGRLISIARGIPQNSAPSQKEGPGTRRYLDNCAETATKEGDGGHKQSIQWGTEKWSLLRGLEQGRAVWIPYQTLDHAAAHTGATSVASMTLGSPSVRDELWTIHGGCVLEHGESLRQRCAICSPPDSSRHSQLKKWEEDVPLAFYAGDSAYFASARRADLAA
ncbi:hypothetical protein EVAR_64506_1 [Eumeta japonica]|uniref:Uncharacterized protein n=1 Tax=Eumeta variegata TaxID=151549 RepID=A0A4C1Z5C6_EUMVA|nr:hypothetical protein EVAR_64506_1 [Eumeta japonica]